MSYIKELMFVVLMGTGINCSLDLSTLKGTGYLDGSVESRSSDRGSAVIQNIPPYDGSSYKQSYQDLSVDVKNGCYINPLNSLDEIAIHDGEWSIHPEGYLQQTEYGVWKRSYIDRIFSNFNYAVQVRLPFTGSSDRKMAGIIFRYSFLGSDDEIGYHLFIQHDHKSQLLGLVKNNRRDEVPSYKLLDSERINSIYDIWQNLRVRAVGSIIETYFNEDLIFTVEDEDYYSGHVGFESYGGESHFRDLVVCEE